jgi:chromatin structure-remodeling complex protein RSC7
MLYPSSMQPTHARAEQIPPGNEDAASADEPPTLPPVPEKVSRNFLVTDVYLQAPPAGVAAASYELPYRAPGDRPDFLAPFRGLSAVSDEIRNLLPPECRAAFDKAAGVEKAWHAGWGDEKDAMARRAPVIDKAVVPFSMMQ